MSLCHQRIPRNPSPLGKPEHVDRPGVQIFSDREHLGYSYRLGRRKLGLTIRRVQYSASILYPDGRAAAFLENYRNLEAARQAAERWIEQQVSRDQARSGQRRGIPRSKQKRPGDASRRG